MSKGKHKGNNSLLNEKRDNELYSTFRHIVKSILDTRGYVSTIEAIEIARNSPSSCFFIGYDRAYRILLDMDKHNYWHYSPSTPFRPASPLRNVFDSKRGLFIDLYSQYESFRKMYPNESRMESVIRACDSPAKRFYINFDTARKIITAIARQRNENIKSCTIQEK